jgi:molybdate transport system ATP-binding protein
MSTLEFRCRHRYQDGFQIEIDLDVDVRFTALFGPSGSGKTSMLSMIAGLLRPRHGVIRFAGQTFLDTAAGTCLPPEARGVGVVFQDSLLFPHLTVDANLRYGARWRRAKRRSVELERVVEVLGIEGLLGRYPRNLSGGERQRVALGRALLSGPGLLLMDEPLASLDAALKGRVLAYLERVASEWDIPTLFVTHSRADVRRAADRVVLIQRGRLLGCGPVDEAMAHFGTEAAAPAEVDPR